LPGERLINTWINNGSLNYANPALSILAITLRFPAIGALISLIFGAQLNDSELIGGSL